MSSKSVITSLPALVAILAVTAAAADETATADVIYASFDRVYLNAGAVEGIRQGDRLSVEGGLQDERIEIVEVGDHTAAGRILNSGADIRPGDRVFYRRAVAAAEPPEPKRERPEHLTADEAVSLWTASNEANPPLVVKYEKDDDGIAAASVNGHAETDYHLYTYIQDPGFTRHEQRFSFWTEGRDLGVEGLDVRLRGQVFARYDNNEDAYLDGRHGIPLIREVAVSYRPNKRAFIGTIGRFSPRMPQASIIDGAEAGFELGTVSLSAFGGLKPTKKDLVPTIHQQTFGAAVEFRPDLGALQFATEEGAAAEIRDGVFSRAVLTVDNRLSAGAKWYASQIASFDFLGSDDAGHSASDFAVSLLGLNGAYRLNNRLSLDLRARYDEQTTFAEDVSDLSAKWIDSLRGARHARAELGLVALSLKKHRWRPYVFGRGDFNNGIDRASVGAGFQMDNPSIFSSSTRMLVVFDFGYGTQQISNLNFSFDTPLIRDRLSLRSGLFNTWTRQQYTSINTLRHLVYAALDGRIVNNLHLFADLSGAYDHALVRLTYPLGGWIQLQAGASYNW
jgi:hypothetical protein